MFSLSFFSIFLSSKARTFDSSDYSTEHPCPGCPETTEVNQEIVDFAVSQFSGIEKDNECYTLEVENFQSQVDLSRCLIVIDIDCVFSPAGSRDDLLLRLSSEAKNKSILHSGRGQVSCSGVPRARVDCGATQRSPVGQDNLCRGGPTAGLQ